MSISVINLWVEWLYTSNGIKDEQYHNTGDLENAYKMIKIQNTYIEFVTLKAGIVSYCRPSIFNNVFIHK